MSQETPHDLFRAAVNAARNAYSPYSGFVVGAAVQTTDGAVFTGANMENASYGLTVDAEMGALQAASTAGKLSEITQIAVVGGTRDAGKRNGAVVTPCGRCRQLILEAAHLGRRDIDVWCADLDLKSIEHFKISQLLPESFGPTNLGKASPA
jgi:cytidine deaminase